MVLVLSSQSVIPIRGRRGDGPQYRRGGSDRRKPSCRGPRSQAHNKISSFKPRVVRLPAFLGLDAVNGARRGELLPLCKPFRAVECPDPLFTTEFLACWSCTGIQSVKIPPRSPDLNAYAERFVWNIKES